MTGHSVATWHGKDIPFVKADFSNGKAGKYQKHPAVSRKVTGMWVAYYNAYQNDAAMQKARLAVEKTDARVLLIIDRISNPRIHPAREIINCSIVERASV